MSGHAAAGGGHETGEVVWSFGKVMLTLFALLIVMSVFFGGCHIMSQQWLAPRMPIVHEWPQPAAPQIIIVKPDGTTTASGSTPITITTPSVPAQPNAGGGIIVVGVPGYEIVPQVGPAIRSSDYQIAGPVSPTLEEGRVRLNMRDGMFVHHVNQAYDSQFATPLIIERSCCSSRCGSRCGSYCSRNRCHCPGSGGGPCRCH